PAAACQAGHADPGGAAVGRRRIHVDQDVLGKVVAGAQAEGVVRLLGHGIAALRAEVVGAQAGVDQDVLPLLAPEHLQLVALLVRGRPVTFAAELGGVVGRRQRQVAVLVLVEGVAALREQAGTRLTALRRQPGRRYRPALVA